MITLRQAEKVVRKNDIMYNIIESSNGRLELFLHTEDTAEADELLDLIGDDYLCQCAELYRDIYVFPDYNLYISRPRLLVV